MDSSDLDIDNAAPNVDLSDSDDDVHHIFPQKVSYYQKRKKMRLNLTLNELHIPTKPKNRAWGRSSKTYCSVIHTENNTSVHEQNVQQVDIVAESASGHVEETDRAEVYLETDQMDNDGCHEETTESVDDINVSVQSKCDQTDSYVSVQSVIEDSLAGDISIPCYVQESTDLDVCTLNHTVTEDEQFAHADDVTHCTDSENSDGWTDSDTECDTSAISGLLCNSDFSVYDLCVIMQALAIRHKMSNDAVSDHLSFLRDLLKLPRGSVPSNGTALREFLLLDKINMCEYKYCGNCTSIMENNLCTNSKCKTTSKMPCFFIDISIFDQLKLKFTSEDFVSDLAYKQGLSSLGTYDDVCDTELYRKIRQSGFFDNKYNLTWKLGVDGVPISKSSNVSAWPIFLKPNEVPPEKRKRHAMLAGVWVGHKKPDLNQILEPLINAFMTLYADGMEVTLPDGSITRSHSLIFSVHADLPAKAQLLNMHQFNGAYSCIHCYCMGESVKTPGGGNVRSFPYVENSDIRLRSACEVLHDAKTAEKLRESKKNETIHGIKGHSVLSSLPHFDIVNSVALDYMHQILLGITRSLMKCWFASENHKEAWYCGTKKDMVDSRILQIAPPSYIQRSPRSISTMPHWKATEYRNFLLYYIVPCLRGILPDIYLQHAVLLAVGTYLCCKSSISQQDLSESHECFSKFVKLMPILYKKVFMTLNVHTLLHETHIIKLLGSLHENSNFDFEDLMGNAKSCIHGPQYMHKQIANNLLLQTHMPLFRTKISEEAKKVFDQICQKSRFSSNRLHISDFCQVVGSCIDKDKLSGIKMSMKLCSTSNLEEYDVYSRIYMPNSKSLITSKIYSREQKRMNYCVEYCSEDDNCSYGLVFCYIVNNSKHEGFAVVDNLVPCRQHLINGNILKNAYVHQLVSKVNEHDEKVVVPLANLGTKCIYIEIHEDESLNNCALVCKPPNFSEGS